jgi:type IV pilus assembly protein PilC
VAEAIKYSYSARDLSGEVKSGTMTAESETAVSRRLQTMGLAPISIRKATGKSGSKLSFGAKKVKAKHLGIFCRQFATMVESGLPLVRTIAALSDQIDHPEMQRVLPLIRSDIEGGNSFSAALGKYPSVFPPLMVGMVAAGEASGSLPETMHRVAENYDKEAKLKAKVFSAMLYPAIVFGLAIVMVIIMLLFIVPTFVGVFDNLGGSLPLPTQMLVIASDIMKIAAIPLFIAFFAFSFWWKKNKNSEAVRKIIDPLKLRIPIMGMFVKKIVLARFSRTFGALLDSGVPMLQCLDMTADTAGNIVVAKALKNVQEAVRNGRPLAGPMGQEPVFPSMVTQMIATGEETGNIGGMLGKVADYYDQEVDTTAESLTSILEPIMIVGLALVIGGMVVAMYLPMFQVFELIN